MSINQINLPDFVIAELYSNNLLEEISSESEHITAQTKKTKQEKSTETKEVITGTDTPFQYLGKNLKQFVILVHYSHEVYLPDEQLNFLSNILSACQLNLADVAIINTYHQKIKLLKIENLGAKFIVLFGVDYSLLNIHQAALYQVQKIGDLSIFAAEKLDLHNQTSPEAIQLKKNLWGSLKQMLQIG